MSFDNSRYTFDPWKDYLGVVMEQGRVQLDSDWNEWLAEFARRIQAGTMDTIGRAVYPSTTPFAFHITASAGALKIGAGRMYVDGLLAENHGPWGSAQWDPALEEMSGAPQIDGATEVTVDFTHQPYLPGAALPEGSGPFLAYLDVWRRDVTYLEDPNLVDKAVAVDTSGRLQTVWQVKMLDVSGVAGVSCATPDSGIPAWEALIAPSAGQLTTGVSNSTPSGPCCLTSNTGYTGRENQLYRVQIHQAGTPGGDPAATFKWSRDDGSVQTAVNAIVAVTNTAGNPASQLSVASMGRDQVLGFAPGNWIEITDDYQELNGQTGELHQIDSIDFAQKTITLDSTVSAASYPVNGTGQTDATRHTRITRWDSAGAIPVPAAGTAIGLENGITVTFGLNPAGGSFYTGDYWTFAARTADGSVEQLTNAYPRGIHHHYARLSIVTFPATATDCRVEWPPASGASGGCCCSVTVQPGDLTGGVTLQTIIDKYQGLQTPTEICLSTGSYSLTAPLRFQAAHSNIALKACPDGGVQIRVQPGQENQFADGMIVLDNVLSVSLQGMYFAVPLVNFVPQGGKFGGLAVNSLDPDVQTMVNNLVVSIGVRAVNCSGLTIENCEFGFQDFEEDIPNPNAQPFGVGVLASGQCSDWRIAGTTFAGVGDFLAGVLVSPSVTFASVKGAPAVGAQLPDAAAVTNIGKLQRIFTGGTSTPNLAAQGGSVLAASLDQAVFEDNSFDGCTVAALVLGASETVSFLRNEVADCTAGFWLVSPLQSGLIPSDPNNVALTGLSIAMGYPLPKGDTTPAGQIVKVAAAPASGRIFAGTLNFKDSQGDLWQPDTKATNVTSTGGALSHPNPPPAIAGALPSATDQALYQSERWGASFSYTFRKLPPGFYTVTLKFAELVWKTAGARIFNVSLNGVQVLTNLDVVQYAFGPDIAYDTIFSNIVPNAQGEIVVQFTGTNFGSDSNAKIGAVEVDPQWNGSLPPSLTTRKQSELVYFYAQLAQLGQQGFINTVSAPQQLRMDANEMAGLSSVGILVLGDDETQNPKTSSAMITANRVDTTIDFVVISGGNSIGSVGSSGERFFIFAVVIDSLTRCVVSSNMIINEKTGNSDETGACFWLSSGVAAPLTQMVPAPEIIVSGNLFQGVVFIRPLRFAANQGIPSPMNSWNFLNTVITR